MSWLDLGIVVVLIVALIRGAVRGLIKEIFGLIGIVLAIYIGLELSHTLTDLFLGSGRDPQQVLIGQIILFVIIFIVVCVLANLLGMLVSRGVKAVALGFVDRILGAILGLLEGFAFVAVVLYLVSNTSYGVKLITGSMWGTDILMIVSTVLSGFFGGTGQDLQKMFQASTNGA